MLREDAFFQTLSQSPEPLRALHNSCHPHGPLFGHGHDCPDTETEYENVKGLAQGHTAGQWGKELKRAMPSPRLVSIWELEHQ